MRKLLFLIILFTSCDSSDSHGNLSIFNEPSEEQLSKWIEIDSVTDIDAYNRKGITL